jgi:predicted PurR-regulated permease PerM
MGRFVRLGLIGLAIGTSLFLWEAVVLGIGLLFPQAFLQLGECVLGLILGSVFAQILQPAFEGIAESFPRLLAAAILCFLGLTLICCGLALGLWQFAQQNRQAKAPETNTH